MNKENIDIVSKWFIRGFPGYCFGSNKELYRLPHKSGRNHYGLRKIKKQTYNRWLIKGKFWSENQLSDKIYLNPDPQILIPCNDTPF